jgi:hypothetical protein
MNESEELFNTFTSSDNDVHLFRAQQATTNASLDALSHAKESTVDNGGQWAESLPRRQAVKL